MSRQHIQQQRLKEVSGLISTLTEQMMTAYVVGTRPSESQIIAFCRGVILLEEHSVPLPLFAEDVIARLQAQDDASRAAAQPAPAPQRVSILDRLLHPFRSLQVAWS